MRRLLVAVSVCVLACEPAKSPQPPDAGPLDITDPKQLLAAIDSMQGELKDRPKSFEVLSALGNLYYENGRYLEAIDALRLALEKAAPVEAEASALRAKKIVPAKELPLECRRTGQGYGFEQIAEQARKRVATDAPAALRCYDEALEPVLGARARRGNAFYLIGHADSALAIHKKLLETNPDFPESLFFVGAILLEQSHGDEAKLEEGKKYWKRLLEVAPEHPRAALVKESLPKVKELFGPKAQEQADGTMPPNHPPMDGPPMNAPPLTGDDALPPNHPPLDGAVTRAPPLGPNGGDVGSPMAHRGATPAELAGGPSPETIKNVGEAVAQTERTPEMEKGLDDLVVQAERDLDAGNAQAARDKLVRVMPFRPNDARVAATLGGAMRGLGKLDMAERVIGRSLELNPNEPRALFESARLSAQKGDKAGAKAKLQTLQQVDAKWASAHGAAQELAKLQ